MHRHNVLKQICGLLRIPIRNAPFGRKCQCSINFARWKNILTPKLLLNFIFNYHQKTQRLQGVKLSNFGQYRAGNETDVGKSKIENEENGKKKIVENKNATSKTYLISAQIIIQIRLISDFKRRIYGYGCSLYRSQRDRVSILPRSRLTDSCS